MNLWSYKYRTIPNKTVTVLILKWSLFVEVNLCESIWIYKSLFLCEGGQGRWKRHRTRKVKESYTGRTIPMKSVSILTTRSSLYCWCKYVCEHHRIYKCQCLLPEMEQGRRMLSTQLRMVSLKCFPPHWPQTHHSLLMSVCAQRKKTTPNQYPPGNHHAIHV